MFSVPFFSFSFFNFAFFAYFNINACTCAHPRHDSRNIWEICINKIVFVFFEEKEKNRNRNVSTVSICLAAECFSFRLKCFNLLFVFLYVRAGCVPWKRACLSLLSALRQPSMDECVIKWHYFCGFAEYRQIALNAIEYMHVEMIFWIREKRHRSGLQPKWNLAKSNTAKSIWNTLWCKASTQRQINKNAK